MKMANILLWLGTLVCGGAAFGQGTFAGLGFLPGGGSSSEGTAVNASGSVVVGNCVDGSGSNIAFRWTRLDGMESLGSFPGGASSWANGVSRDGSVVVGRASQAFSEFAFRWTGAGGMVNLGGLPGADSSEAISISGDGSVIAGVSVS